MYNVVVRTTSMMHILYLILFESSDCIFDSMRTHVSEVGENDKNYGLTSIIYVSYGGSNEL